MKSFLEYLNEDLTSAVKTSLEKYKARKLSDHYDISHEGDRVTFKHRKKNPGSPYYHTSHVRAALHKNGLTAVGDDEHHDNGFTLKVKRL
jgi:hypothetical protein